jgi:hypothetical protein
MYTSKSDAGYVAVATPDELYFVSVIFPFIIELPPTPSFLVQADKKSAIAIIDPMKYSFFIVK